MKTIRAPIVFLWDQMFKSMIYNTFEERCYMTCMDRYISGRFGDCLTFHNRATKVWSSRSRPELLRYGCGGLPLAPLPSFACTASFDFPGEIKKNVQKLLP